MSDCATSFTKVVSSSNVLGRREKPSVPTVGLTTTAVVFSSLIDVPPFRLYYGRKRRPLRPSPPFTAPRWPIHRGVVFSIEKKLRSLLQYSTNQHEIIPRR